MKNEKEQEAQELLENVVEQELKEELTSLLEYQALLVAVLETSKQFKEFE